MGRPRARVRPADSALGALLDWAHLRLDEAGVSYADIAVTARYDPSWVSRSLCGRRVPDWHIIRAVAARCSSSVTEARSLWSAADEARRQRLAEVTAGYPPVGMTTYTELCVALRELIADRVGSHRELVRHDDSGVLTRSTVGAVLRGERSLAPQVLTQAVRACELDEEAMLAWQMEWRRLGEPIREAMDQRRRTIARARLRPYGVGRYRW